LLQAIKNRFGLDDGTAFQIQYYDTEWESYVDVEDCMQLADKTKLRCNLSVVRSSSITQNLSSTARQGEQLSVDEHSVQSSAHCYWPVRFDFPVEKLPRQVHDALEKQVNLCHPKNRYLRGLLLHTLCDEAVKIKSHPDHSQKVDMAKSIIIQWPYLTEQIGRGFDGWLASIVDCLKTTRRNLGIIDKVRSAAVLKRKPTATSLSPLKRRRVAMEPAVEGGIRGSGSQSSSSHDSRGRTIEPAAHSEGGIRGSGSQSSSSQDSCGTAMEPAAHSEGGIRGSGSQSSSSQDSCGTAMEPAAHSSQVEDGIRGSGSRASSCSQDNAGAIAEMKILWKKADAQSDPVLLKLLADTFDDRRAWLYSSCKQTVELKDMYPALFCRKAVVQEFGLIVKERKWMQLAVERALLKTPKFIEIATRQVRLLGVSKKLSAKQRRMDEVLRKLDLALDERRDEEMAAKHRAIAGLLLMPHILGDSFGYLYSTSEVRIDDRCIVNVFIFNLLITYLCFPGNSLGYFFVIFAHS